MPGNGMDGWMGNAVCSYLPEWFLFELLCRLPIREVLKFKGVSKQCLSFISHPSFYDHHCSRGLALPFAFLPSPVQLVERHDRQSRASYLKFSELRSFTLPTAEIEGLPATVFIKAIDKGFLLAGMENRSMVYPTNHHHLPYNRCFVYTVCNALTKQRLTFHPHKFQTQVNVGFIAQVEAGVLTDFRVVSVDCYTVPKTFLNLHMFTSYAKKWRWVDLTLSSERPVLISSTKRPALLNRTLFWMDENGGGILAYDPYADPHKLCIIELPTPANSETSNCGVSQGRLKCFQIIKPGDRHQSKSFKIWELQEDEKWSLQHTIGTKDIVLPSIDRGIQLHSINRAKLASFHPFTPDVVYLYCWGEDFFLVSYNMQTKKIQLDPADVSRNQSHQNLDGLGPYPCLPLVLPPCPTLSISPSLKSYPWLP